MKTLEPNCVHILHKYVSHLEFSTLFQDKVNDLDSDDSTEESSNQTDEKERHSSGESQDSAISISPPQSPSKRFLVIPANLASTKSSLRGILKRSRALSESQADKYLSLMMPSCESGSTITEEDEELSENDDTKSVESLTKKSVRFNEVVQRQVYRQNSSILGQKMKNMKKAEQKKRKADQKRRASEGDLPDSCGSSIGKSPASYYR